MITDDPDIHRLTCEDKEIILVGTAHLSVESADLVSRVIEEEKPDTVCPELCQSRYQALTQGTQWQNTDLYKVIKEKKAFLLLSNLMLASFQRRLGKKLGVKPGEEMIRAIQAAEATGAAVHLVDRDIRVTLGRTWRLMGFWTKSKLLAEFLSSVWEADAISKEDVEELKRKDVLEALLSEIGKSLPEVQRVLIDERDQYLAFKIRNAPGKKIVAVIGAGHVPGVRKHWEEPVDMASLEQMPPKGRFSSIFKWTFPALIVGLVVLGFFTAGSLTAGHMLKWWLLANITLSGLGAAAALGHPLTILSAMVGAPFAAIHPLIAAGWISGLVEVLVVKPKVKDFESLLEDISSIRGFWKNKITRVLLVVVLTNLGASIGNLAAIPLMVRLLG
jgi:pheromone shutdown-related protein TraB